MTLISNGSYHSNNLFFWDRKCSNSLVTPQYSSQVNMDHFNGKVDYPSTFYLMDMCYGQGLKQGKIHKMYFTVIKRPDRFRLRWRQPSYPFSSVAISHRYTYTFKNAHTHTHTHTTSTCMYTHTRKHACSQAH